MAKFYMRIRKATDKMVTLYTVLNGIDSGYKVVYTSRLEPEVFHAHGSVSDALTDWSLSSIRL